MSLNPLLLDATELAQAIATGQVSCREVMAAYLDRIERCNPAVNAIVALRPREELEAEAARADAELAQKGPQGWMHGFPIAVKDLDPVRGLPWTEGSPAYRDRVAAADSIQVERMRASGAILIGKTNTPEFGLGSHTYNGVYGVTRNPYDAGRSAGGSSGGAAAAVALRMLPVADGSDHAGSLRNPTAFNNVYGLRPSYGRVPALQADVFANTLGVAGPVARNPRDLANLLAVQAGPDPRAPLSIREPPSVFAHHARAPSASLRGRRIAWLGTLGGHLPMEPGVTAVCERALSVFEDLGCVVEPVALDFPVEAIFEQWLVLRAWAIYRQLRPLYEDPVKRAMLGDQAQWELENGLRLTPAGLAEAEAFRTRWFHFVAALHRQYDVLALPSAQVFPFDAAWKWPTEIAGRAMDTYHRWMEVVIPGTMSGCPVIGLPAGFDERGLPMGMQLIGPMHGELLCLDMARAYDDATSWARRRPPPAFPL
ncbi:MAG: amidase [Pigmentiphaga sp.]|uniref:amidase n=1 Tax=Pigmentiphaga sp. TaxID=1977564 RepID=UPI0029B8F641|nr:amidase [Pigmentiphaga sp.]MDX3906235.1 amidase [Pigmentiphaga sp.]